MSPTNVTLISPLSLAVQPAGALRGAEGELRGAEVSVRTLAVILPLNAGAPRPPDGVTRGGAESLAQVAAGGQQGLQVAQAEADIMSNFVKERILMSH